jgi:hypothetical protein
MLTKSSRNIACVVAIVAPLPFVGLISIAESPISQRDIASSMTMLSMFLWPFLVCRIARTRTIAWGVATSLICFSVWFLSGYLLLEDWEGLEQDALSLIAGLAFAVMSGASIGGMIERELRGRGLYLDRSENK